MASTAESLLHLQSTSTQEEFKNFDGRVTSHIVAVRENRVRSAATGIGLALRNLAPNTRSIGERYIENHRKFRSLAPDWPAP